ncbi:MAG: SDR family oxidoreductase [Acidobacteria bacterium]|jgi:NAD(P)-dependent dehydrogenase (short-subunit alcohol dehydrogenase family)|nr:MAG: SDR family oxidoreductase [Acidobacteriota bacterium]GIU82474.1 MAG: oxidoreductase [Pyrinomonadaceae bacterium]
MNLEGKTVLIVGAGRGIGRATAELFSEARANVVICSRNFAELMELEYKLNSKGNPNVLAMEVDASVQSDVQTLVDETLKKFGSIDFLIHTAGLGILKPFDALTLKDFEDSINANLKTAFVVLKTVLPVMAEKKFGRVVMIPGVLGKAPMAQASVYCAAKYGLTGMIKCLKEEYKRSGIRFSLMHFGGVDSTFWDGITTMRVDRSKMLTVEDAARAIFFAATQDGEGVVAEIALMPESHQLI